jgi:hypothetical protein
MKIRILILLASLFLSTTACAYQIGGEMFDDAQRKTYRNHHCQWGVWECALAMSSDGAFGYGVYLGIEMSKVRAMAQCQIYSQEPDTCEIVDVGGTSDFIKGGDEPIDTLFPAALSPPAPTLKERLLDLRSLVDEGLITEEDYVQAKKKILDGM